MKQTYQQLRERVAELERSMSDLVQESSRADLLEDQYRIFKAVVAQSPASILITDANGLITYVNDAFKHTLGFSQREIDDEFMLSILSDEKNFSDYEDLKRAVQSGKVWRGELNIARKDKQPLLVRLTIFPLIYENQIKNYVGIINDISAQRAFETITREKDTIYKTLIENIPLAIAIYDNKGRFIFANQKTDELFNLPVGSLIGKTFHEMFPKETADDQMKVIRQIFRTALPVISDRTVFWHGHTLRINVIRQPLFDDQGKVNSILAIGQDKTEQTRHENMLDIQHQIDSLGNLSVNLKGSLKRAFSYLMKIDWIDVGGVYLFDEERKTLKLVYATGLSKEYIRQVEEFSSKEIHVRAVLQGTSRFAKVSEFIEPTRKFLIKEGLALAVAIPLIYDKKVIGSLNLGSKNVDQVHEPDRMIIESIASRIANLIMLVMTQMQLDRSNNELNTRLQELSLKQQLLIQKSRLESLGELSAGLAHEINQPLTVISLVIENINQRIEQQKASGEYLAGKLASINQNINKIKKLIEHVRIFSRDQGSITFEQVDVNQVIMNALSMVESQLINNHIKVTTDLSDEIGYTIGNPARFEQVMLNLISNARDALEEKDKKGLSDGISREIRVSTSREKNRVVIRVWDNGTGITSANLDKIFNPFFTTKSEGKGTGLGLPIVYGIISEMKGEIDVNTEEGKFTELAINLPQYVKK